MNANSPDQHATGFLHLDLDPLRYDGHTLDPWETTGMIASLVPTGKRVLDVGCGTGSMSKLLVDSRGAKLIGIEPDLQRAEKARERGLEVRHGIFDAEMAAQLGIFDVVIFADVLEHLPDPFAVLSLTRQVLSRDGMVIVSVPNVAHWSVRYELLFGRFEYESCGIMDATHLRWFTEHTIKGLLESAGFRIDAVQQTAGVGGSVYYEYLLWRMFRPRRYRPPLIRRLTKMMPRLFGYQHVIRACVS